MLNLDYHHIEIVRFKKTNQVLIKGEITNNSGKSYNSVAVRIVLFIKNMSIVNQVFVINDLLKGSTKAFERNIYELKPNQTVEDILRFEIFTESCY